MRLPKPTLGSRSGAIRSSIHSTGPTRTWCCAPRDAPKLAQAKRESRRCWSECCEHNRRERPGTSPSHGENRGSSPLGSANDFKELSSRGILEGVTYGINTAYPLMIEAEWWSPSPTVLANQIQPLTAPRPPLIRSKPDDHPRALPQGDGIAGPAFAGGAESGEHNLVVLDRRRARRCFPRWRSTYRRGR